jgi:hypothetical protein
LGSTPPRLAVVALRLSNIEPVPMGCYEDTDWFGEGMALLFIKRQCYRSIIPLYIGGKLTRRPEDASAASPKSRISRTGNGTLGRAFSTEIIRVFPPVVMNADCGPTVGLVAKKPNNATGLVLNRNS